MCVGDVYIAMVVRWRCVEGCVHSHGSALEVCGGDVYIAMVVCCGCLFGVMGR